MHSWCHCEIHKLNYPCRDGCPYCREDKGEILREFNPSRREKPLKVNRNGRK